MQRTLVYKRDDIFYVVSQIKTVQGWRLAAPPVVEVSPDGGALLLGSAILDSLQAYREDAPHPTDFSDENDPVLRAIGVGSWDDMSSLSATLCYVEREQDKVQVIPTIGDEAGGYTPDRSRSRECTPSRKDIGEAVLSLLGGD